MEKNEAIKNFLVNSEDTGRFIITSLKTGKKYYVEPLDGGEKIDWDEKEIE